MKSLHHNWLTEGWIDFEYKKYMLLGYLQHVKENFDALRLYPWLSDLMFHYNNILLIRDKKKLLYENFPKSISRADFEKLELVYQKLVNDDHIMHELEEIISFSLPRLEKTLSEGKEVYEDVEHSLSFEPVGLTPLNRDSGYLMILNGVYSETNIYQYEMTIFTRAEEKYRGLHINFVENVSKNMSNTFESIKVYLIRKYQHLPNPATYLVNAKDVLPLEETLLPLAKRMLVRHLAVA